MRAYELIHLITFVLGIRRKNETTMDATLLPRHNAPALIHHITFPRHFNAATHAVGRPNNRLATSQRQTFLCHFQVKIGLFRNSFF